MHLMPALLTILLFAGCASREAVEPAAEPIDSKIPMAAPEKNEPLQEKSIEEIEAVPAESDDDERVSLPPEEDATAVHTEADTPIADLHKYPQNVLDYSSNIKNRNILASIQQAYTKHYFSPWNFRKPPESLGAVKWPFRSYRAKGSYGQNLKPLPQEWFDEMLETANFKDYATENSYAITLRFSNLRNFPTHKPLFRNPESAGEGFPFDYLQNSGIHANEPVFVSHYSSDRAWVYVFSAYATGWLRTHEVALLSKNDTMRWQNAKQLHIIKDGYPVKDAKNRFVFYARLGMMLPIIKSADDGHTVLTVTAGAYGQPTFTHVKIPKDVGIEEALPLNEQTLPSIANEAMKSRYGWGGLYGERDCSSTLRDLYAPFGIWLPRNSSQQARVGKVISFKGMDREAKLKTIKEKGIPFETLLYRKGHILLYIGEYDGHIMVLHNVWGVKTKNGDEEGRKIIGKTVISTLDIGCEQPDYDKENNLLDNLKSMNIITIRKK